MGNLITAGELAKLASTTKRTIHFYDEKGVLKPRKINSKKYRFYEEQQVLDYQMILLLSTLGVPLDEIKRYLSSKSLPAGASIRNLNFKFNGARATMTGFVNVPIPLVGGKINFNLELANNQNGEGVTVTNYSVDTKSGTLRSRLDQIEPYLKNINSFIADDINEGLQYSNKFLRVLGLSITPEGKFAIKVQNSVQAAA